jgi:type III pantothenate kinase
VRLLLDAGNTRLKWGLRAGGDWLGQGVVDYAQLAALTGVLPEAPRELPAFGVNVAGPAVAAAIANALAGSSLAPVWLQAQAEGGGVVSRYTDPGQLGADRWAALVGARTLHAGACLVVTAGTATTVDVLDAEGIFEGGLILPGFDLMRRALAGNTAGLGYAEGKVVEFPRNTADAIYAGCIHAQAGAVEHMFARLAERANALCLVSGGAAEVLAANLALPCRVVPNLVLEGLSRLTEVPADGPPMTRLAP